MQHYPFGYVTPVRVRSSRNNSGEEMNMKKIFLAFAIAGCSALWGAALGQTPAPSSQPAAPGAAAPSPATPAAPITDADLTAISTPTQAAKAKGDPNASSSGPWAHIPSLVDR